MIMKDTRAHRRVLAWHETRAAIAGLKNQTLDVNMERGDA